MQINKILWMRYAITVILGAITVALLTFIFVSVYQARMESRSLPSVFSTIFPTQKKEENIYPPLGVMLENELMSRPFQTGLSAAAIVYEAPTEGNITRFLAIFPFRAEEETTEAQSTTSAGYQIKFGPIRSSRTYFLDWMHEYKGVYVHVGGRYDAIARLSKEKIYNADQFLYDKYFWRENVGRTALEHTMFSSGEKILELIKEQKWIFDEKNLHPFLRAKNHDALSAQTPAIKIKINFGSPTYMVLYEYDATKNKYLRSQAGAAHIDRRTGKQIEAATIIVQKVDAHANGDAAGSISIKTIGKGEALIFANGKVIKGTWEKKSLDEPTQFFDEKGNEIFPSADFNSACWIEILPNYNKVKFE